MDHSEQPSALLRLGFSTEARLRHVLICIWQALGLLFILTFLMPYTCTLVNNQCSQIMSTTWSAWLPLWSGFSPSATSFIWHIILLAVAVVLFRNLVLNLLHGIFQTELVFEEHCLYWYLPTLHLRTKTIDLKNIAYIDVYNHNIDHLLSQAPANITLRARLTPWPLLTYHARDFTNSQTNYHNLPTLIMLYCPHLIFRFLQK